MVYQLDATQLEGLTLASCVLSSFDAQAAPATVARVAVAAQVAAARAAVLVEGQMAVRAATIHAALQVAAARLVARWHRERGCGR
mmetsp:Transcript_34227/g.68152  ORF Transcript_34227/g.68152 Transcript_34227/m.68152 type:complete len:85 (+) Transcript_34227:172-426(+)